MKSITITSDNDGEIIWTHVRINCKLSSICKIDIEKCNEDCGLFIESPICIYSKKDNARRI